MTDALKFIKSYDELRRESAAGPTLATAGPRPPRGDNPTAARPAATTVHKDTRPANGRLRNGSRDAHAAESLYGRAATAVSGLFGAAAMESLTPGRLLTATTPLRSIAPEVVQSTSMTRDLLRRAMGTYAEGEGFILPHSVNVAILGVELGRAMSLPAAALETICLAGFVHDLGSVRLPAELLTKEGGLTPNEWDQMRSRPTRSYELLRSLGSRYQQVAEIAHQVHERLDGSGYPRGLKGDEILPEALILGTVDCFESFAHPRPYRAGVDGGANHGIKMLMQMTDKFGAKTLKALVAGFGLFPIGSLVRLSGGEIGRVVDVASENPMRPRVEVLLTNERRPPRESRTLDLLSQPNICVSRALTASDLRELGLLPRPSEDPWLSPFDDSRS